MAWIRKTLRRGQKTAWETGRLSAVFLVLAIVVSHYDPALAEDISVPETVSVPAGSFDYRMSGEYLEDGYPVDAPLEKVRFSKSFQMMRYQVRAGDYEACVSENKCRKRLGQGKHAPNLPVTGVSYRDAVAYAEWLSGKTAYKWRLPTDREWAYAAGSRYIDDAANVEKDTKNPATRWLAKYKKYADRQTGRDLVVKDPGAYGANEFGLYDLSGNIWEWTDTCYTRTRLDEDGATTSRTDNCGVRISAGQHRAYVSFFIQDAKGGGCSVGAPPDYLGFRLIRGEKIHWWQKVAKLLKG